MRRIALAGMSLENSYFTQDRIAQVIGVLATNNQYDQVNALIVEGPALHNYRALEQDEKKAKERTHKKGNNLRNKASRAVKSLDETLSNKARVLHWVMPNKKLDKTVPHIIYDNPNGDPHYDKTLLEVTSAYTHDNSFRETTDSQVRSVIEGLSGKRASDNQVTTAKNFLLEELAYLMATPSRFNAKVDYVYHLDFPIFENLITGRYDTKPTDNIEFRKLVLKK